MTRRRLRAFIAVSLGCVALSAVAIRGLVGAPTTPEERRRPKDDPKGATAYRLLRMQNESRKFDPNDLLKGIQQKRSMSTKRQVWSSSTVSTANAGLSPLGWEELGPGNIGGRMRSILIHPTTPNIMYLGAVSGGVWKTTDGGSSWAPLNDMMANLGISCMVMDPTNPNIIYAGTGEAFRGAGIFKTTDGGVTWNQLPATNNENYHYVKRIAISPTNSLHLLAGTSAGLFRSLDGGGSWSTSPELTPEIVNVRFHPTNGSKAVAGTGWSCQAFYSNDGGDTWSPAAGIPTDAASGGWCRVELAYARSNPAIVYAVVDRNHGEPYKSTDGGVTYVRQGAETFLFDQQGFHDAVVWVDPTNPQNLIVGGVNLRRSTDGGVTWNYVGDGIHVDQHAIVEHPQFASNRLVFIGNDGGIYRVRDDFSTTTELNNNLRITQFFAGAANQTNNFIIGGTQDNNNLRYAGNAEDWRSVSCCDGGYVAAHPFLDPDGSSYFYTHTQGFYGGPSRTKLSATGEDLGSESFVNLPSDEGNFIPAIALDPNDPGRLYKAGTQLWLIPSPRTGTFITPVSVKAALTLNPEDAGARIISAVTVAPGNSNIIWVGHNGGDIYLTQNGTATSPGWVRRDNTSPPLPDRFVTSFAVDPFNNNRVYATFGGFSPDNVWRSDNGGATWTDVTANLPDIPVYVVTVNPYKPSRIYVGTELGVFGSDDAGASWSPSNEGPTNAPVEDLFWMQNRLVSATHGRSMFRITVDTPASSTLTAPLDGSYFQPGTTVNLTASAADANGTVTKVQFLAGTTLLGEDLSSPYSFSWTNVPAGTHALKARAFDSDGNMTDSALVTIRSLPSPWLSADVGSVGVAGSAYYAGGTFTVKGSGTDIWGTADGMRFVYRSMTGNGQIVARVAGVQNTDGFAKAGVMIRESLNANSKNALVAVTPANGVTFQTRTATGGTTTSSRTSGIVAPHWVRLVRNGSTLSAYRSTDGTTWTQQGAGVNISMASTVFVGLAVTSHNNTALNTSTISNVTFTPGNSTALLVVGNTTLNAGDTAIRNRLQGLGYAVTVKSAAAALPDDAAGKTLVFISSTGTSTATADKFTWVDTPVISAEAFIYDDMGMTGPTANTDYGNVSGQTQLNVVASTHPLAGGLSGTVTFSTVSGTINFGVPPVNATRVGVLVGDSNRAAVFGYEKMVSLANGANAIARRVGSYLFDSTAANLTLQGWTLFDAAVTWASGGS